MKFETSQAAGRMIALATLTIATLPAAAQPFVPAGDIFLDDRLPVSIVAADFDLDGTIEYVIAGAWCDEGGGGFCFPFPCDTDDTISMMADHGGGYGDTILASYPDSGGPRSVAAGDVTGDGYPEVLTEQGWMLNNGDGTFGPVLSHGVPGTVIALEDVDGDHDLDVVTDQAFAENVGGFLSAPVPHVITGTKIVLGDVDGDGNLDLVTERERLLYIGGGFGAPVAHPNMGPGSVGVTLGDIDGDDDLDMAVVSYGTVHVIKNDGNGSFTEIADVRPLDWGRSVAMIDTDGDDDLDLAVGDYDGDVAPGTGGEILFMQNDGDGCFGPLVRGVDVSMPGTILVLDVDGDDRDDLVVAQPFARYHVCSGSVEILLNNHDSYASVFEVADRFEANYPTDLATADLNGDGRLDLVTMGRFDVDVFLGNAGGSLAHDGTYEGPDAEGDMHAIAVTVADFDGDDAPDIAIGATDSNAGAVIIRWNDGDGTFDTSTIFPVARQLQTDIVAGDFNADDAMDIAVIHYSVGFPGVTFLENAGGGTFTNAGALSTAGTPRALATADLDGDDDFDLVLLDGDAQIWYTDGNGAWSLQTALTASDPFHDVTIDDVTGNGQPDVIAVSSTEAVVGQHYEEFFAAQTFAFAAPGTGYGSVDLVVGDLDGDDAKDIAVTSSGSGNVRVLTNSGNGFFDDATWDWSHGLSLASTGGDVDGDGDFDLITIGVRVTSADFSGQEVVVLHNTRLATLCPADVNRDGTVGFADLIALLSAWGPCSDAHDLNDDGVVGFEDLIGVLSAWGPC